jgi:hypothetical protein
MDMNEMVVHFPWLHPKLGRGLLPEGAVFFDPGVDLPTELIRWRPSDLPCSPAEVRAILRSYMEFGERFPRSSDMQAYQAAGLDNFYTDTTMDIKSQLTGMDSPKEVDPADLRRQAQLLLAMALSREEQFVAMREQEGRFETARQGFAEVLGLDDEESFAQIGVPDEALFPRANVELPWKSLLPCLLLFLPPGARLFISDDDVLRELIALELDFSPCADDPGDLVCCRLDREAAERICGRRVDLATPVILMARPLNP